MSYQNSENSQEIKNTNNLVEIYTDGACLGNPGPGGWGALLICGDMRKEIYGGEPNTTTNNRMEVMAAIKALEFLTDHPFKVRLYTDSTYLCKGAEKCVGTRTPRMPGSNEDLWKMLRKASMPHQIEWKWVRGHSGNHGNERADALANKGLAEIVDGKESVEESGVSDGELQQVDICINVNGDRLKGADHYHWNGLLSCGDSCKKLHAENPDTTHNRMYISAATEILKTLENPCDVLFHTDSQYLCDGASKYIIGWQRKGWRKSDNSPVQNKDLWMKYLEISKKHKIKWVKESKSSIMYRMA